jgi:cell wall-associated NlpC family hydrolase
MSRFTTTDASAIANNADTQNLTVVAVNLNVYKRSIYKSVSAEEIMRKQLLTSIRIDNSPKVAALLANPPFSKLDPVQIMNVAAKYEGVPYAFGGDTPAAFDCSGYVAYVFANFGVPLPHSVHGQDLVGKRIKDEHARPGDLVVFDDLSHDGIYAGNGNFWHAPRRGDRVKLAPIYSANIHFVRIVKPE